MADPDTTGDFRRVCGDELIISILLERDVQDHPDNSELRIIDGETIRIDPDACPLPGSPEAEINKELIDALLDIEAIPSGGPAVEWDEAEHETDFWTAEQHAEAMGVETLKGADASGRDMDMARLSGMDLSGTNFAGASMVGAYGYGTDFSGSNFNGADLATMKFRETGLHPAANLTGASFIGADLTVAEMYKVDASGANFTDATMVMTQMSGLTARSAIFDGANLTDANLLHVDVTDASFVGADLTGARISHEIDGHDGSYKTRLPSTFDGADFTDAKMSGIEITGSFVSTNFTHADLSGAYISGQSFINMDGSETFRGNLDRRVHPTANRIMPHADFTDADLRGARLDSNLRGVNFSGANLEGADLSNTAHQVLWEDPQMRARGLGRGWDSLHAVDFSGVNLKNANLSNTYFEAGWGDVRFDGANLEGANFEGAQFVMRNYKEGITFEGANLRGANFHGASFRNLGDEGRITFKDADITGADFSGVDLSDVSGLTAEQLRSAILSEDTILPEEFRDTISLPNTPDISTDAPTTAPVITPGTEAAPLTPR